MTPNSAAFSPICTVIRPFFFFQSYAMVVFPLVVLLSNLAGILSIFDTNFPHEIVQFAERHDRHDGEKAIFEFAAFGKSYRAVVYKTRPPIHPQFRIVGAEEKEIFTDFQGTYSGALEGKGGSKVHLSRMAGESFLGYLKDGDDFLHFEPARTHFPAAGSSETVVYKEKDIVKRSTVLSELNSPLLAPQSRSFREKRQHPFADYIRSQRYVPSLANESKNRCPLKIVADHRFFQMVGKGDKATTARYIMNTVAKVNEIYQVINWDEDHEDKVEGRGRFYNFGFSIKELKIWDKPSPEPGHYNGNDTDSDGGTWSSNRLLEAFTQLESSPKYCIVHLMTAQSFFDRSSLGLAYVATDENAGICADTRHFGDRIGSYNTLFTSVIGNAGKKDYPLVTREAEIVVAHEYGHSWGAVHDEPKLHEVIMLNETCIPDFKGGGKYIMNPFAQVGFDPNNNKFSPCSVHMIRKILQRRWNKCFEVEQNSLCGNGVIEEGEECDEGALLPTSTGSSCCSRNCTLLPRAQCSPLNMPCCSGTCRFHNSSHICLPQDTWQCKSTSYCSGTSGECPLPKPVQDKTTCADDGVCQDGNCVPYCETLASGKKSCLCEELHLSCRRCCRGNNGTGPCLPEEGAADLADGSWCVQGYCKHSRCITEVADYAAYYLSAFHDGSVFWKFVRSNIVFMVVVISVPLWCLFGYYIQIYDQRRQAVQDREVVHFRTIPIVPAVMRERSPVIVDDHDFF